MKYDIEELDEDFKETLDGFAEDLKKYNMPDKEIKEFIESFYWAVASEFGQ